MPDSPAVSIVVPVYRQEKYLGQCLDSVASQSFHDWECVVVDDGSDEPDIIDCLVRRSVGNRGSVIHQKNSGLATARNNGIESASGRYVLCLDADDCLHPKFLEKASALLEKTSQPGVVYCRTRYFGDRQDLVVPPTAIHLFWLLQRNLIPVTCLFSKEIWHSVGGFDNDMRTGHEDWDFWIRVCLAGYRFRYLDDALFFYRQSSSSMIPTMSRYRVFTVRYIRHKYPQIYFMPLKSLFRFPAFQGIPGRAIVRFWLSSLFFHYMPSTMMWGVFRVYQKLFEKPA
jgi:glycosyltransferase involved in cell wall biosynthesis